MINVYALVFRSTIALGLKYFYVVFFHLVARTRYILSELWE